MRDFKYGKADDKLRMRKPVTVSTSNATAKAKLQVATFRFKVEAEYEPGHEMANQTELFMDYKQACKFYSDCKSKITEHVVMSKNDGSTINAKKADWRKLFEWTNNAE